MFFPKPPAVPRCGSFGVLRPLQSFGFLESLVRWAFAYAQTSANFPAPQTSSCRTPASRSSFMAASGTDIRAARGRQRRAPETSFGRGSLRQTFVGTRRRPGRCDAAAGGCGSSGSAKAIHLAGLRPVFSPCVTTLRYAAEWLEKMRYGRQWSRLANENDGALEPPSETTADASSPLVTTMVIAAQVVWCEARLGSQMLNGVLTKSSRSLAH
jgi:hypothetical protein